MPLGQPVELRLHFVHSPEIFALVDQQLIGEPVDLVAHCCQAIVVLDPRVVHAALMQGQKLAFECYVDRGEGQPKETEHQSREACRLRPWPECDELDFAFRPQINLPLAKCMSHGGCDAAPPSVNVRLVAPHLCPTPDFRPIRPKSDATENR